MIYNVGGRWCQKNFFGTFGTTQSQNLGANVPIFFFEFFWFFQLCRGIRSPKNLKQRKGRQRKNNKRQSKLWSEVSALKLCFIRNGNMTDGTTERYDAHFVNKLWAKSIVWTKTFDPTLSRDIIRIITWRRKMSSILGKSSLNRKRREHRRVEYLAKISELNQVTWADRHKHERTHRESLNEFNIQAGIHCK